ncbi:MAG: hypothetical protein AABZ39_02855, partial [Spirochaetota bacterium]
LFPDNGTYFIETAYGQLKGIGYRGTGTIHEPGGGVGGLSENFGERFKSICRGIKQLAERNPDISIVYPVHLNPNVQEPANRILGGLDRILF